MHGKSTIIFIKITIPQLTHSVQTMKLYKLLTPYVNLISKMTHTTTMIIKNNLKQSYATININ